MTNEVGSDTALWHTQQAAIQAQIAAGCDRRGMYWAAEQARIKAQKHRDQAAALDLDNQTEAA